MLIEPKQEKHAFLGKHESMLTEQEWMRSDVYAHKKHAFVKRNDGRKDIVHVGRATRKSMLSRYKKFLRAQLKRTDNVKKHAFLQHELRFS